MLFSLFLFVVKIPLRWKISFYHQIKRVSFSSLARNIFPSGSAATAWCVEFTSISSQEENGFYTPDLILFKGHHKVSPEGFIFTYFNKLWIILRLTSHLHLRCTFFTSQSLLFWRKIQLESCQNSFVLKWIISLCNSDRHSIQFL